MNIHHVLKYLYWRLLKSPEEYARHIGVNIGVDNLIEYSHWSSEPYLISIGSHCQLTNCKIHTHGGSQCIRKDYPDFDCFGKVVIGDYVYIGTGAQIMPGVTIGDNVLIAAGSIVTRSIPSGSVVAGNPAKIICTIDEYYQRNKRFDLNSKHLSSKEKKELLLSLPNDNFIQK